jgi:glycosyltransferase involved in cell wall biosynthesis
MRRSAPKVLTERISQDTRALRIALVVPSIMNSANGVHFYLASLVGQLCGAGCGVTLIAADLGHQGGPSGPSIKLDSRAAVKLFQVKSRVDRRIYRVPEMRDWLSANARNFDVADIQGMWSFVAVDAAEAFHLAGVPYLITPHGQATRKDWDKHRIAKQMFYAARLRRAWRRAQAIHWLCDNELRDSIPRADERAVIVPGAVAVTPPDITGEIAKSFRARLGISPSQHVILFLGRITEQKGVLEIVNAFERLYQERRDVTLVLAGPLDGTYGSSVARKIANLSCRQAIKMPGPLYDEEKRAAMASASLFITLSSHEGLPRALLEALSSGIPTVTTASSNLPEVEMYRAGRLVDRDPSRVAAVMDEMLSDPEGLQHMSANARRLIAERFSPNVVLQRTVEMYRHVAQSSSQ